jgi:Protein of unknown function (DUF3147)
MIVAARLAPLKEIKPHEYAMRFLFGGCCTMIAGLIASHYGPRVGGLFLAFPAIFPASASLIEKHQIADKREAGFDGQARGRVMAGLDAVGAAIGCIGLVGFATVVWKALPAPGSYAVIGSATIVWLVISAIFWLLRKSRLLRRRMSRTPRSTELHSH